VTTALQSWTSALFDLLVDARDELDSEAYEWFVAIGTELFGLEAARLAVGEALRAKRGDGRRAT
jgi:hypothetical protein